LAELQEAFYYYKTECKDAFTDDELIEYTVKVFNGRAHGSAEYLISTSLDDLRRYAVQDLLIEKTKTVQNRWTAISQNPPPVQNWYYTRTVQNIGGYLPDMMCITGRTCCPAASTTNRWFRWRTFFRVSAIWRRIWGELKRKTAFAALFKGRAGTDIQFIYSGLCGYAVQPV